MLAAFALMAPVSAAASAPDPLAEPLSSATVVASRPPDAAPPPEAAPPTSATSPVDVASGPPAVSAQGGLEVTAPAQASPPEPLGDPAPVPAAGDRPTRIQGEGARTPVESTRELASSLEIPVAGEGHRAEVTREVLVEPETRSAPPAPAEPTVDESPYAGAPLPAPLAVPALPGPAGATPLPAPADGSRPAPRADSTPRAARHLESAGAEGISLVLEHRPSAALLAPDVVITGGLSSSGSEEAASHSLGQLLAGAPVDQSTRARRGAPPPKSSDPEVPPPPGPLGVGPGASGAAAASAMGAGALAVLLTMVFLSPVVVPRTLRFARPPGPLVAFRSPLERPG